MQPIALSNRSQVITILEVVEILEILDFLDALDFFCQFSQWAGEEAVDGPGQQDVDGEDEPHDESRC